MYKKLFAISILLSVFFISCNKESFINQPGNLVPKTVIEDLTLPYIMINGAKLHSQAFGHEDSTLIICIHGGPGANYRYLLNCKSLADKGYRVVYYDQRGSGLSERFPEEWYANFGSNTVEKVFYDDLNGVIKHYKTHENQKVVLIGHSWGAMLATGFTGKNPTMVDGLIIAEPGGLKWDDIMTYIGNSLSYGLWSEAFNDITFVDQFVSGKKNQHAILDYKYMMMGATNTITGDIKSDIGDNSIYYKNERGGAVINLAMAKAGQTYEPDLSANIDQFHKKTLFIYSGNNQAYPDSWAQKIAAVFTNKELLKVDGVGHSGMFDQINTWTNITEPKVIEYLNNL